MKSLFADCYMKPIIHSNCINLHKPTYVRKQNIKIHFTKKKKKRGDNIKISKAICEYPHMG